ncbi:glycerophosphodiester phosphodiesterase [Micrococcales bacterium 31B]|nr:glycerophosphodiester phosphodiesterase [Micrococcales bacterium 31B]
MITRLAHELNDPNRRQPVPMAHRGNKQVAPENSPAAFVAAVKAGLRYIETDVQRTRDGDAVVIHDPTLDRTTDRSGTISELTRDELRGTDCGAWFDPAYAGQELWDVRDLLDYLVREPGVDILLEFKDEWPVDDIERIAESVRERGLEQRVLLQSFHPQTVRNFVPAAPEFDHGLLVELSHAEWGSEPLRRLERLLDEVTVCCVNPDKNDILANPALPGWLRERGYRCVTWTVDDPVEWETMTAAGVDCIISNRPDALVGHLGARAPLAGERCVD